MIAALLHLLVLAWTAAAAAAAPDAGPLAPLAAGRDGRWTMTFAAADGVEGDCRSVTVRDRAAGGRAWFHGRWPADALAPGPVRVTVRLARGRLADCRLQVGGCPAPAGAADLGEVPPAAAAGWLLERAGGADGDAGAEAVTAAAVARDGVPAAALAALVRDRGAGPEARRAALQWLALRAARETVGTAADLIAAPDEDAELREHAVFALSRLEEETALALLLEVAGGHPDPRLRRAALFALAEHDDPRVLALYERILAGG